MVRGMSSLEIESWATSGRSKGMIEEDCELALNYGFPSLFILIIRMPSPYPDAAFCPVSVE